MKTVTLTNENQVVTTITEPRRINVVLDTCGYDESPRDWSNIGTLLGFHRDYDLCENEDFKDVDRYSNQVNIFLDKVKKDGGCVFGLYCFEHSEIRFSIIPFRDSFDSGQVGYYYATKETLLENELDSEKDFKRISDLMENELVIYNKFLNGEVWRIIDNLGELDCGGYYDFSQAMESIAEAGLLEFIDEEYTG